MSNEDGIKPCPFCDSGDVKAYSMGTAWNVACNACDTFGPLIKSPSDEGVVYCSPGETTDARRYSENYGRALAAWNKALRPTDVNQESEK